MLWVDAGRRLKCQPAFLDAALRESDQAFAVEVEVNESEAGAQSVVVLGHPPIAHLVEAEDSFEDAERMFYLRPHARLTFILFLL